MVYVSDFSGIFFKILFSIINMNLQTFSQQDSFYFMGKKRWIVLTLFRMFGWGADSSAGYDDIVDLDVDVEAERARVLASGQNTKDVLQVF